MNKKAILRF